MRGARPAAMIAAMLAALAAVAAAPSARGEAALRFLSVGSGELDGGYYETARALCAVVNAAEAGRLRCSPEATPGSRYNIDALAAGELEFAIAQADLAFTAYHGAALYSGRPPRQGLRTVAPLYVETVTVLARPGAGIANHRDLVGKRVDIGPPSSGRNATARALLAALEADLDAFAETLRMPAALAVEALCAGRIDATFLVVGHPSEIVAEAMARCGAATVAIAGPQLARVVAAAPYYRPGVVPASAYPELANDTPTVEVSALLVTSLAIPEEMVARVAGALLAARERLRGRAPLLGLLGRGASAQTGAPPLHPGAAAALKR